MFLGKYWTEVVRVDVSVVSILLFWVDVPTVGESIGFHAKASRAKANKKVKLAEKLQPAGLPASEEF